jgi:hypothetical protein
MTLRRFLTWARTVLVFFLVVVAAANCGDDAGSETAVATATALAVTPSPLALAAGTSATLVAKVTLSDGTTQDLTTSAVWSTSAAAIATVTGGKVAGLKTGLATITAAVSGLTATVPVTVAAPTLVSLDLTPAAPTLAKGLTKQLVATGTFTDKSTSDLSSKVTWSSASAAVATASATGLVTGVGAGTSAISAKLGAITGTTKVTVTDAEVVSIALTPPAPTSPKGVTQQFMATATMTDGTTQDVTTQVAWASSAPAVATIDPASGLAMGVTKGTSTISATRAAIVGSTTLTVTDAQLVSIGVTPALPSIAKGLKQQFTATGTYSDATTQNITTQVTWASATPATATISNAAGSAGLAQSVDIGTTSITATKGAVTASTTLTVTAATLVSIAVTPANPSIAKGLTQQFVATGTYTDATTQILTTSATWASTVVATATISNAAGSNGLATSAAVGTTSITATMGAITGSTTLTVTAATLVSIAVTPVSPSIAKGLKQQFTATGTYTDASTKDITTTVTWASGAVATATISNAAGSNGSATSAAIGTTTISATLGAITDSTTLTVTAATLVSIAVTPANPSIAKGLTQQFTATGTYTDASTQPLTTTATWGSATLATATISNAAGSNGLATSAGIGTSVISATLGAVSGSTTLTVTAPVVKTIAVTPLTPTIHGNTTQQFTATGTYSDASTADITASVTWGSSAMAVATINAAGLATAGAGVGTTTISATLGAVSGNTVLTVALLPTSCKVVAGHAWCYNPAACGEACTAVCSSIGMNLTISDAAWFALQDSVAECTAISVAFGNNIAPNFGSFGWACMESSPGEVNNAPPSTTQGMLCSNTPGCPAQHRTHMDNLGGACGASGRRSICPCN